MYILNDRHHKDGFLVFSILYAITILFMYAAELKQWEFLDFRYFHLHPFTTIAANIACISALFVLFFPSNLLIFLAMVAGHWAYTAIKMPSVSNHQIMELFIETAILIGVVECMVRQRSWKITSAMLYQYIAPVGRIMLVIMYFYGTFHKINTDFLNPEVSCAVHLWKKFFYFPEVIRHTYWIQVTTIYGALFIEALAMVLLWIPRFKYIGIIVGILFHILLGTNGISSLVNFSMLAITLHFLFLPPDALERLRQHRLMQWMQQKALRRSVLQYACILFILFSVGYFAFGLWIPFRKVLWLILAGLLLGFVILFGKYYSHANAPRMGYIIPRSIGGFFIMLLFFVNCLMPYIGLKTESSLTMFSNLYTEGGQTNHLFFKEPPYLFDWQNDIVQIINSTDSVLQSSFMGYGLGIPFVQLRDWLSLHPNSAIQYIRKGQVYTVYNVAENKELSTPYPWWVHKWIYFKPVDFYRPKHCSH